MTTTALPSQIANLLDNAIKSGRTAMLWMDQRVRLIHMFSITISWIFAPRIAAWSPLLTQILLIRKDVKIIVSLVTIWMAFECLRTMLVLAFQGKRANFYVAVTARIQTSHADNHWRVRNLSIITTTFISRFTSGILLAANAMLSGCSLSRWLRSTDPEATNMMILDSLGAILVVRVMAEHASLSSNYQGLHTWQMRRSLGVIVVHSGARQSLDVEFILSVLLYTVLRAGQWYGADATLPIVRFILADHMVHLFIMAAIGTWVPKLLYTLGEASSAFSFAGYRDASMRYYEKSIDTTRQLASGIAWPVIFFIALPYRDALLVVMTLAANILSKQAVGMIIMVPPMRERRVER